MSTSTTATGAIPLCWMLPESLLPPDPPPPKPPFGAPGDPPAPPPPNHRYSPGPGFNAPTPVVPVAGPGV